MFGGVYVLWIYYLLVRAAEAIGVPFYAFVALLLGVGVLYPGFYRDKHTFLYMFHVVVMWVSWIGIGAGVAFQLEIGSATDFLFFHALWNAYVGALAYLYMPTHGGMLIHDEDEKTAMARAGGGDDDDDGGGGDRDLDGDGGGGSDARFAIGGYHDDDDDDTGRANGGPGDDGGGVELTEIQVMPGAGHAEEATLSSGSEDDGAGVGGKMTPRDGGGKKKRGGAKDQQEREAAPPGIVVDEEVDDQQIVEL